MENVDEERTVVDEEEKGNKLILRLDKSKYEVSEKITGEVQVEVREGKEEFDCFKLHLRGVCLTEWEGAIASSEAERDICSQLEEICSERVELDPRKHLLAPLSREISAGIAEKSADKLERHIYPFSFQLAEKTPPSMDHRSLGKTWNKKVKAIVEYTLSLTAVRSNAKAIHLTHKFAFPNFDIIKFFRVTLKNYFIMKGCK